MALVPVLLYSISMEHRDMNIGLGLRQRVCCVLSPYASYAFGSAKCRLFLVIRQLVVKQFQWEVHPWL